MVLFLIRQRIAVKPEGIGTGDRDDVWRESRSFLLGDPMSRYWHSFGRPPRRRRLLFRATTADPAHVP